MRTSMAIWMGPTNRVLRITAQTNGITLSGKNVRQIGNEEKGEKSLSFGKARNLGKGEKLSF